MNRVTESQVRQLNLRLRRFVLADKVRLANHCRVGGF